METSENLQVNCSPETLRQTSDDPEYAKKCSQLFLPDVDQHFNENIYTSIGKIPEVPVELHNDISTKISTGNIWTDAAAKVLLSNFKDLSVKVGTSSNLKNKTRLWRTIAENMAKEGYTFSPSQVESKFRGLEKKYKKIKLNSSQTGRNRSTCMYQNELDEILGINPEYTLNIESQNIPASPSSASSQEALDDVPISSVRASETEELLKKLEEISQRKKERHNKIVELLEKKENNRKIKEKEKKERGKRREEIANRLITLLEKVAEKITK